MQTLLFTVSGLSLLFLVAADVYATILHARARSGPISDTLNRGLWRAARAVAFRLSRQRRHRLLNSVGPLLLPALIAVIVLLLVFGFALIYYPHLPGEFRTEEDVIPSQFFTAFYFSASTLTTVGYGDISPASPLVRLIAVTEAATGFALISLAVTYLLSVYRALESKRVVALSFYHQAEEGADVAGFIRHYFVAGSFHGLEVVLRDAARDVQALLEAHVEHPVIHYFHPIEVYKSMPRVLFLTLETCAVVRACLDAREYAMIRDHPELRTLESSARHVLAQLSSALDLGGESGADRRGGESLEEFARWRRRFAQTTQSLRAAHILVRSDAAEAWEEYRHNRDEWEARLRIFSAYLGYDWEEVTGDRDLEYAADEGMAEPGTRPAVDAS
jgi:voltage-gated potassium channel Kch